MGGQNSEKTRSGEEARNGISAAQSDYIRVRESYVRMKTAQTIEQTVYIYGVTGYGKTEMVKHFMGNKRYRFCSCKKGRMESQQPENSAETVVIDDLQFLKGEEERKKVLTMLANPSLWVILISRSPVPGWLQPAYMKNPFVIIEEKDLIWTEVNVAQYFALHEVEVTEEQIREIWTVTKGSPMMVRLSANISVQDGGYHDQVLKKAWRSVEEYLEYGIVDEWDPNLVDFLMYMSFLDQFTVELAELVTGNNDAYRMIQEARELGNFITAVGEDSYSLRPILRSSLVKRARRQWGSERCQQIYYNAGRFYELRDQVLQALDMYEKSGNQDWIMELLSRNARKNPGNGYYFQLKKYYLALPEEDVKKDPVLISGMSMLYSLLMEPEKSEYWYEQLKVYEKKQSGARKRQARSRIAYLDIALPHRGITGVLEMVKAIPELLFRNGIELPEFSVTSNLPSVMNGGKDFSQWSRKDRELAAGIGKAVRLVLGSYGKGLVPIALAESLYEKGEDHYEIISLLSRGSLEAENGGKLEMEFAAAGIQVRLNLAHGNDTAAMNVLEAFERKAERNQAEGILKTIQAMKCRIALYRGETEPVKKWLPQAPDENREFFIMERYRYLTKVRCYLLRGDYLSALYLLEKLEVYAKQYQRTLIEIETEVLAAITCYRMGKEDWVRRFTRAVSLAESYGFYRGISEEGAALKKLWQDPAFQKQIPEGNAFWRRLRKETEAMALFFPSYLNTQIAAPPEISEKALQILKMQAEGLSYGDIARIMGIKETTVKYHCSGTYKKLGVTGKADAIMAARDMKLI